MAKAVDGATCTAVAVDGDVPEKTDDQKKVFYVLVSKIDSSAKTLMFFPYPPSIQLVRECPAGYEALNARLPSIKPLAGCIPIVHEVDALSAGVRVTFTVTKRFMYNAIAHVFKATNIRKSTTTSTNWNIFWGRHLKSSEFAALLSFQKVNHFPGSFELGRKDRLCSNLLRMRKKHPLAYSSVIPETYLTANEYDKKQFIAQFHANPHVLWILKPPNLSCGRGIKLITAASCPAPKLSKKKAYVAQKYVTQPFLINELKFDLRIYVLVTSYDPLRIYLFNDGLVRFCTEKYSIAKSALQNPFGHLTNYSVNKKNTAAFQQNQDAGDDDESAFSSSKWSLQMLYKYLNEQGKSKELAGFQVTLEDLIIKTLLAVESKILMMANSNSSGAQNGFELYGFDILLEGEDMKPWLLEVNVFPSLSSSSPMDKRIKTILVSDMFQLVGVPFQDAQSAVQQLEKDKQERLHGVNRLRKASNSSNTSMSAAPQKEQQKKAGKKQIVEDLLKNHYQNPQSATSRGMPLELSDEELQIVKQMEEEELRRGHFKRIFPTSQSFDRYHELFETARFRNVLCMLWLRQSAWSQSGHHRRPTK